MSETTIPTLYAMLASYCLAGCIMEHFAIAPGWAVVGKADLSSLHKVQSDGMAIIYVVPKIALTVCTTIMLFNPPTGIPSWVLHFGTAVLFLSWVISFLLQFPLQRKIRKGDQRAVENLVFNDWFRVGCISAIFILVIVGVVF